MTQTISHFQNFMPKKPHIFERDNIGRNPCPRVDKPGDSDLPGQAVGREEERLAGQLGRLHPSSCQSRWVGHHHHADGHDSGDEDGKEEVTQWRLGTYVRSDIWWLSCCIWLFICLCYRCAVHLQHIMCYTFGQFFDPWTNFFAESVMDGLGDGRGSCKR